MPEKKQESFKVTDRRSFTLDGEARPDAVDEVPAPSEPPAKPAPSAQQTATASQPVVPPPPTAAEQQQQADAYRQSARELDRRVELSGHSARELEMTFERFLASLYMTAMLQLGLMREEGAQPQIDLIGARQTIDTISLLAEKTKGNLTPVEENFLQNSLYELRMAYVEVTNALARPPQVAGAEPAKR